MFFRFYNRSTFVMSNYLKIYVMKKFIKNSLVILVLFLSLSTQANELSKINTKGREIINLTLEDVEQGSMLRIKDLKGLVLFKESILKNGDYTKGFDLTLLPDGEYYFELQSISKIDVIPFYVKLNTVTFEKDKKETIFIPTIIMKGNKAFVSQSSIMSEPLECAIYFTENNDLVLKEKFKSEQAIKRVYDFSIAAKGNYTVVFTYEGRIFSQNIKI